MSYPDVLNLFKHEAQLIKKTGCGAHRLYSFSIATNVAHSQKQERLLVTQSSLQSMLRLRLFVVRKQGRNQGRTGSNQGGIQKIMKISKTYLVVRYCTTSIYNHMRFSPPRKYQPLAALLQSIDIRGSIHDDAQIKSSSTLSLFLGFVFMATSAACLSQNAFCN